MPITLMIVLTSKCINTKQSLFTLESTFLHTRRIASLDMDASNGVHGKDGVRFND